MNENRSKYLLGATIGAIILAFVVQIASVLRSFSAEETHIAAFLILGVVIASVLDGVMMHLLIDEGGTFEQQAAGWFAMITMFLVLCVDIILLINPAAFADSGDFWSKARYLPFVNLAVSFFCVIVFAQRDDGHKAKREQRKQDVEAIKLGMAAAMKTPEAKSIHSRIALKRMAKSYAALLGVTESDAEAMLTNSETPTKVIDQPRAPIIQTPQQEGARIAQQDAPVVNFTTPNP